MSRDVVFYGERGILNSIILDMQGDISRQKKFLSSIVLGDKTNLSWVDDVYMFKYLVEPCLEDFGTPNLIIEAITKNHDKYVLLIQSKLNSYEDSALKLSPIMSSNGDYLPQKYRNNKINIELALLYRFIKSYKNTSFDNNFKKMINESEDISKTYNDDEERNLKNKIIINYWDKHFKDAKEYYFIALTNDSRKIIEMENVNSEMFPFNNPDIIPPIGNEQWDLDKDKFGILTYDTLLDKKVILKNMGYYKDTSELMWFDPPINSLYNKNNNFQTLTIIDSDRWNENQQILSDLLKDVKDLDEDFKLIVNDFMKSIQCE